MNYFALRSHQDLDKGKVVDCFDLEPGETKPIVRIVDENGRAVVACHDLATISEVDAARIVAIPRMMRLLDRLAAMVEDEYLTDDSRMVDVVEARRLLGEIQLLGRIERSVRTPDEVRDDWGLCTDREMYL